MSTGPIQPAPFATDARSRLTHATRRLIDMGLTTEDLTEAELDTAASTVEAMVERLTGEADGRRRSARRRSRTEAGHGAYLARSPLLGIAHPAAPPFEWSVSNGRVAATGVFGAAHEGPPGYAHGGWIALAFDELLGLVNVVNEAPAMTGRLSVRYRHPTPLHTTVRMETWTERVDGRRILARGTLHVDDTCCAESEGLFVTLSIDHVARYFATPPEGP